MKDVKFNFAEWERHEKMDLIEAMIKDEEFTVFRVADCCVTDSSMISVTED